MSLSTVTPTRRCSGRSPSRRTGGSSSSWATSGEGRRPPVPVHESASMDDAEVASGDVVVASCCDGLAHSFRVLDDGVMVRPACGSPVHQVGASSGGDVVCEVCIGIVAVLFGADLREMRDSV